MDANAPYLPPIEPTDNKPTKRHGKRTVFLWLLLILMFVAIYQLFSGPGPGHHDHLAHAAPPPPRDDSGSNALIGMLPAIGIVLLFVLFLWRQLRGGAKLYGRLEPGYLALADGDLGGAAAVFSSVAQQYRKQATYAGVARLSLSTTLMRQGELARATDEAIAVERTPGLLFGSEVRLHAAVHLAMLYTLRGQLDAARRWCEEGRRRLARGQNRTLTAALLRLAEILLLARDGKRDEAARALDRDRPRLEESLSVSSMKKAWLLRAWCAAADGTRGSVEPWLTMARSGRTGELRWLGTEWPELRAFIDAHDL